VIIDNEKYRVNLICSCQQDVAYGYGADPLVARRNAEMVFREHHGAKTQYRQIVVEEAVTHAGGGSHYELFAAGLRYEFTRGLGERLHQLEQLGDALDKRDHSTHPYVFESNNPTRAAQVCDALRAIADSPSKNGKLREAAQRALDEIKRIARAVWATWNGLCPAGKHGLDFEGQACDLCAISK